MVDEMTVFAGTETPSTTSGHRSETEQIDALARSLHAWISTLLDRLRVQSIVELWVDTSFACKEGIDEEDNIHDDEESESYLSQDVGQSNRV